MSQPSSSRPGRRLNRPTMSSIFTYRQDLKTELDNRATFCVAAQMSHGPKSGTRCSGVNFKIWAYRYLLVPQWWIIIQRQIITMALACAGYFHWGKGVKVRTFISFFFCPTFLLRKLTLICLCRLPNKTNLLPVKFLLPTILFASSSPCYSVQTWNS